MMKNISSFLEKKILLLSPKLDVLYNIFTCILTTSQSRSHYFIDVGNEDQKSLSVLICPMANKSELESSSD